MRRQRPLPPGITSPQTTQTGSSIWSWRLRRRKRDPEQKRETDSTFVTAEFSEEGKSSSGGIEVTTIGQSNLPKAASNRVEWGIPSNAMFLAPQESPLQTGRRSVQPFLHIPLA